MATVSQPLPLTAAPSRWELAAEAIAVKIRWFGLLIGAVLVNIEEHAPPNRAILHAILALGCVFTLLDTYQSLHGSVFLGRYPLAVSALEALFIGLLCYFDRGVESPFRYYYILSLLCCAIRHPPQITYVTCAFHCLSYGLLYLVLPPGEKGLAPFALSLVVLGWVTWAASALALLLKRVGEYLGRLNAMLKANQAELEARIDERTRELQEAQAHVLHQEKMAAFGLLAAGIAHEVGNPLTSISALVQMLQRREADPYSVERLSLVSGQLQRIRTTLRELVEFSRPASGVRSRVALGDILDEALNIAKYYKRTRGRIVTPALPPDLPPLIGVRDQLVQVFLNLVLNAIDAVSDSPDHREGRIDLEVARLETGVEVTVRDNGPGITPADQARLFRPYFTTKKHGTGLGLFVTRQLVLEHGGNLTFSSRPGEGATFRVFLPIADCGLRIADCGSHSPEVRP
jgi:signal transduction histidine kinase